MLVFVLSAPIIPGRIFCICLMPVFQGKPDCCIGYNMCLLSWVENHNTRTLTKKTAKVVYRNSCLLYMITYKNIFQNIITFENLYSAAYYASKGKRSNPTVIDFFFNLEENILELQRQLREKIYQPGNYRVFQIYDPKPRQISAAPFIDRVVHHALMNIINPIFEKSLIFDTYANRVGKGTHRAIKRYQYFLRQNDFVLKCDIKKYFQTIDHEILKTILRKKIADSNAIWLLDKIIDNSVNQIDIQLFFPGDDLFVNFERKKGLPIGNLTSQYFANYYLNSFDHFVKEKLGCKGYLRYVDDFILFSNNKEVLNIWKKNIEDYLISLRLKLNFERTSLYSSSVPFAFLGQIITRENRRLTKNNVVKFNRNLVKWSQFPPRNFNQRVQSWLGHAKNANSTALIESLRLKFPDLII